MKNSFVLFVPGCLFLFTSCIFNTSGQLDELSKSYTGYVRTGDIYKTREGYCERVMSGDYERSQPFFAFSKSVNTDEAYSYRELSPEKKEGFLPVKKMEIADHAVVSGYEPIAGSLLLVREDVGRLQLQKIQGGAKAVLTNSVTRGEFEVTDERRSLSGKILMPFVYADFVVVDVPLNVAGYAAVCVYGVVSSTIWFFSNLSESIKEECTEG